MNNRTTQLFYILPALLLYAAWPVSSFTFLVFIALVPLFAIELHTKSTSRFFWILWLNLLTWNTLTTWWIWNASPGGAVGAIVANSLLMCFPWMLYRFARKNAGQGIAFTAFTLYWLTWEYIHHNWDLSWPWLTLGNVFSLHPNWVQWYEITGTTGGSLWVILVNILLFRSFYNTKENRWQFVPVPVKTLAGILAILLPLLVSYFFIPAPKPAKQAQPNVVVVQPNVEPYTEKFNTDPALLIDKMIRLSNTQTDSNTRLVIWPETAIPVEVWENEIATNHYYKAVFGFVKSHPQIELVSGIDSYRNWGRAGKKGFSIRTMNSGDQYEAYNTAFATDSSEQFQLYHKTKLVPGVEALPSWLGFMSSIFDDLGGTTGTLGRSDSAVVFSFAHNPYHPAPIICYESIYSDYVTEYVKRGANLLTIVTNDGWWGETPGFKQHMNMARLRAIENRRWVARSANTGISCFISPSGEVLQPQPWNIASAIKMNIEPLEAMTFYSRNGDWLSRIIWPAAALLLLFTIFSAVKKRGAN